MTYSRNERFRQEDDMEPAEVNAEIVAEATRP